MENEKMKANTPRVTVPVEPTEAMIKAAADAFPRSHPSVSLLIYRAMLSAAPAPEGGEVRDALREMLALVLLKYGNLDEAVNAAVERAQSALATREEAPADSAHPCYDEHQPGCDCEIPPQSAAPMPSYLERLRAPAEAGEDERLTISHAISTFHMLDMLTNSDPCIAAGAAFALADRILALRAQPPAREDAQPLGCFCDEADCPSCSSINPAPDALWTALSALIENAVAARGCGIKNDPDGIVSGALFDTIMNGREAMRAIQAEQKGGA